MATKRQADGPTGLKPFTIISGEPRKIDCYIRDGTLSVYWAKSKADVIEHLLRTDDGSLRGIPLSKDSDYINTPSAYHYVMCRDSSCPCDKYVMCWECEATKEPLPAEGVELVSCNGYKEILTTCEEDEPAKCECQTPMFPSKVKLCCDAIENYCDSDHCFKLVELAQVNCDPTDSSPKDKEAKTGDQ